jgi:WD40 repeat protein
MNPLSDCKALEVFGLSEIYSLFMAKHLDLEDTKSLSLTCKPLNDLFQNADSTVWRLICNRKFKHIPPQNIKDYKEYYYAITSGRYLAENRFFIEARSIRSASHIGQCKVKLCLSNDRRILFSAAGGTIISWDVHTTQCIDVWDVNNIWNGWNVRDEVTCLTICNDLLFVASKGSLPIQSWNIRDKCSTQFALSGHTDTTVCLGSIRNKKIVSGSKDMTLRVWDLRNFTCLLTLHADGYASHVEIADDKIIGMIVRGENARLKIWNLETGDHLRTIGVVEECTTFAYGNGSILLGLATPVYYSIDELMRPDCNRIPVTREEIKESDSEEIDIDVESEKRCTSLYLAEQLAIFSIGTGTSNELNISLLGRFDVSSTQRFWISNEIVSICSNETMIFTGDRDGWVHFFGLPS